MPIIQPGRGSRVVGMNKNQQPPPLLKMVGNHNASRSRPTNKNGENSVSEKDNDIHARKSKSIDALPESSDEDEDYPRLNANDSFKDSDDSENESRRGDIKPTIFKSTQPSTSQRSSTRRSTRETSKAGNVIKCSQDDEPSSSAGSKRSAEDPTPGADSHLTDSFGFMAVKKTKRTTSGATYGTKSSQPRSSQTRLSQKSAPRSSAPQPAKYGANGKLRRTARSPTPENAPSLPTNGFKKPASMTPEKARSDVFKKPPPDSSSPVRGARKPILRTVSLLSNESPGRPKFNKYNPDGSSDVEVEVKPGPQTGKTTNPRRSGRKTRQTSPEPVKELSPKPTFKLHALDDIDYLDDDNDDNLATTFESTVSGDEIGDISIESPVATTARCPMCHEAVDAELLAKYSDRGRMNIRKQTEFCRKHKRQTALNSRSQKGYPKINWDTLDTRLKAHQGFLKEILEGTRESYFREVLKENVESGKNRTLLKTDDSLTPGYYGPRGLRAMTEYIMRTLSSVVRKRAIEDRLVSARGHTAYVQVVLVPELAVRLIMEDMDVAEEDAREIMQDSIEVGELLYEDAGDVVAAISDEEEYI
ncbi:uncharacterized protein F4822DRAFT_420756 [Hypoxylon trugodes]|uniref:uncharacterized protein n=1 Tax=Hypoxylon trugodes TaxID=326681 RepID=UPI00218F0385|nr:uncharacterized protein F4822DRAFT_420756 [Hypoxylon trugodes]KAI1383474.1 hypothetical protein F4822DRAFT_420756 [Hypoxylon trugodes]